MVSQDNVTGGIKLHQDVIGVLSLTELEVHDTIDTQLFNFFKFFRPHMLPQLHGEARGHILFVAKELSSVQSDTRFDQQMLLSIGF